MAQRSAAAWICSVRPGAGATRGAEDAVGVSVLDQRVAGDGAVQAAHRDDRELPVEGHPLLGDQRHATECLPGTAGVRRLAQHQLALAVVAQSAGLEHQRKSELDDGIVQGALAVDRGEPCRRLPEFDEERLLGQPVLGRFECAHRRPDWGDLFDAPRGDDRDVLPFVGHDLESVGEPDQSILVVHRPGQHRAHRRGRCVVALGVEPAADVQVAGRLSQHQAELAGAEDADPGSSTAHWPGAAMSRRYRMPSNRTWPSRS